MTRLAARLRALFPEASGRSLKQWLASGRVRVDGEVVRDGRVEVTPTARVALGPPAPRVAFPAALRLVHEDEPLLVVDKPPGLLSIATPRERRRTAYRLLWDYLAAQRPPRRPFIVHRLDRETSGLLVVAKTAEAKRKLQTQFEARRVERIYVAVVEGRLREAEGTLRGWLVEDQGLRVRQAPRRAGAEPGKEAITRYRVLERRADTTVLELALGTGRRQQIRVQLAALGHPVVGDAVHGARRGGRLHLHATRLGFEHPTTGERVSFSSPPPAAWSAGHDPGASAGRRARRPTVGGEAGNVVGQG